MVEALIIGGAIVLAAMIMSDKGQRSRGGHQPKPGSADIGIPPTGGSAVKRPRSIIEERGASLSRTNAGARIIDAPEQ